MPITSSMIYSRRAGRRVRSSGILMLFLLLAFLLPPAHAATAAAQAAADAPASLTARIRIGIVKDGVTVVTPADLTNAGVDPASVDPRTFAMSSRGKPVAIYVTGEGDGKFDATDRVYFFGEKFRSDDQMEEKYTDERVYWLDMGGTAGPRMAVVDATPQGNLTPPADFATTIRAEESWVWWSLYTLGMDTEDTWFWTRFQVLSGSAVTATLPYTVPYPANSSATLRLEEISNAYSYYVNPDHRTVATMNGAPVLDQTWDGLRVRKVFTGNVPAGVLVHGTNSLTVGAWLPAGISSDDVYANYWELAYRRLFRAFEGQIDFKAEAGGAQEYAVSGWGAPGVLAWDVTNPNQPVRLSVPAASAAAESAPATDAPRVAAPAASAPATSAPATSAGAISPTATDTSATEVVSPDAEVSGPVGSGPAQYLPKTSAAVSSEPAASADYALRFRVNAAQDNRYWLQAEDAVQAPASVRRRLPTGLRNPTDGADAVIVTSAALRPQAELLAKWHRQHDRRALVVDFQDAVDEFNEGIWHPKAVQNMMKWAAANWTKPAPAYLTLFGDGNWNFKNFNPAAYPPGPNHIPPYLAWEDPWQGEIPVDGLYGDLDGDRLPDIAVGRIAVDTLAEAGVVVDKIMAYDEGPRTADWQKRAIFVADNADSAGDFPTISDNAVATLTPPDLTPVRVYLPPIPVSPDQLAATRTNLFNALNAGALMVQYTGHGAPERWTHEMLFTTADIPNLTNGSRLPVVMTFNCLDGYFVHPTRTSVAETMQRQPNGGSIAALSPTGLGTTPDQQAFREILLKVIFRDNVRELGRALTIAKRQFAQVYGIHYLTQSMSLFGDPAMKIAGTDTAKKTYLPALIR